LGTVGGQNTYGADQVRIIAGAQADDPVFDQMAADHIGHGHRANGQQNIPAALSNIIKSKQKEKQVQGDPEIGIPHQRHQDIKETILPFIVDQIKNILVRVRYHLQNLKP
jgi:hypothetical protein